jgi:hypothetical protein
MGDWRKGGRVVGRKGGGEDGRMSGECLSPSRSRREADAGVVSAGGGRHFVGIGLAHDPRRRPPLRWPRASTGAGPALAWHRN